MAEAYWLDYLTDLEPTRFPDLTGKSASAREDLKGFHSVQQTFQDFEAEPPIITQSICVAACAKLVSLYLGEDDFCIDLLSQLEGETSSSQQDAAIPIRINFKPSNRNDEVLLQVEGDLCQAVKYGPPSEDLKEKILQSTGVDLSNVLVVVRYDLKPVINFTLDNYEKYDLIVELSASNTHSSFLQIMLNIHFKRYIMLAEDIPHVSAALEGSLLQFINNSSSNFHSWPNKPLLQKSTCNLEFKPAHTHGHDVVHAAFEMHAAQRPDHVALDFLEEDGTRTIWTFAVLNSIANRIANQLIRDYHVEIEDSIPICVPKSPAFYACMLGVLKAGGVFTPFTGSPSDRQKFMLHELGAKVLLSTAEYDMSWCHEANIFDVSSLIANSIKSESTVAQEYRPAIASKHLCYQMYTSGSTGRPKAVSLEHRNAVQTACATRDLIPWKPESRMLQQAGVTFDMCYFETFFTWTIGIRLCSAPDSLIYNKLSDIINDMDISLLGLTPSVALTLDPRRVPSVEWMYCIGEALPQSLVEAWEGRLVNSYGPTEAAQMVTLFPVNRRVKSTVIGMPFNNTSFTVLRGNSIDHVPILGVGELCIGGAQVARGYFRNPERTKQSFIELNGDRLYRTGDLVRMLGNNDFEFIGRMDDQVKVRGHRVELGEIDRALKNSHEDIKRACTQILKVTERSKGQLVSFLVPQRHVNVSKQQEIRLAAEVYLSNLLPDYMIPRIFIFTQQIPLSAAGKVNKQVLTQALRDKIQSKCATSNSGEGASVETSDLLQKIYSEFCGLPPSEIGLDMSIYQLGIDSIGAIQIAHRLRDQGFNIQPSNILSCPTITQLLLLMEDRQKQPSICKEQDLLFDFEAFHDRHRLRIAKLCGVSPTKIARVRPASPLQSGLIAQSTHSSGSLYFNHLTYVLPENIDLERFVEAWQAIVSRYEILRSGFAHLDGAEYPVAMITYHTGAFSLPVERFLGDHTDSETWRFQFAKSAVQHIHLPPWRVLIAVERNKFYFSAHHSLYDAQVLDLLMRDLALVYDGARLPASLNIEPHLSRFLSESDVQRGEHDLFWQNFSEKVLPSKFPILNPVLEEIRDTKVVVAQSSSSLLKLQQGCRSAGISMQAAAQAAWAFILAALTGEDIVTFGTVLSGRMAPGADEVLFPMITTVPTAVNTKASWSCITSELLSFNADVQNHQFVPLKRIQKSMGYSGETAFDTIFTFQKRSHKRIFTDTRFEFLNNSLSVQYPVSVELEPTSDGHLSLSVFYQARYMRPEQAKLLINQFHFILDSIIFNKNHALSPQIQDADPRLFSIIPAKHQVIPSEHSLLHHSVEIKASSDPDRIALEFVTNLDGSQYEKRSWTFRRLDEEGNKVAHFLCSRGVKQGSIVAICFEKCPEAPFVMLGISKAGCTFLALDPGAPVDRKKFIIQDSQASILLTKGSLADGLKSVLPDLVFDLEQENLTQYPQFRPILQRAVDPQDTAYCLYTSGTTGTPKGCSVTHENVVQVFCCFERLYAYTEKSRWLQFASYHFDVSVMEHFWSWFVGMTVVKASRDLILQDLANTISTLKITHIDLTPSLARLLDPQDVPSLASGVFVTGGEMLRQDIIEAWGDSGAIHNAYGPTETTIGVTMYRHVPKNGRSSNIGWPFDVVGLFIVHLSNPQVPVLRGGVGELLVAGKLVAKGYLRREKLTKERFIEVGSQKCYRTGDLVRVLSDGSIEFLGRADDQVKLRGQRLEIGEINSVIKQRDERIDDVCTLVVKHPKQQKEQLVSFVAVRGVGSKDEHLSLCDSNRAADLIRRLRDSCAMRLPGYMVPTHILLINKVPLSANNKIESRQLKSLFENIDINRLQGLTHDSNVETAPRANDKASKKISEVLCRVLSLQDQQIPPTANFFELGLDSVLIINFSRALKAAGYKQASPSLLMRNTTVSRLTVALANEELRVRDGTVQAALQQISACKHRFMNLAATSLSVNHEAIEMIMPCTPLQAGIISRSLESNRGLYFAAFSFDLGKDVDLRRLKRACQQVCDRIQMLRTKFIPTDDGYVQVVLRTIELPWLEHEGLNQDHLDKSLRESHKSWWKQNQNEIHRPIEVIITQTTGCTILTLHIFHALYDGNSLPLIMSAVAEEYYGHHEVAYGPAFSEALPYGPLRQLDNTEAFWIQHLSELPNISLPKLHPLSKGVNRQDTCTIRRIEPLSDFEDCRRRLNVTHQAMIQACWTVLLQDTMFGPLVLGMVVSGRSIDLDGADKVIGPLFNTIPFLLLLRRTDNWRSIISRCHEFNSNALAYQHTPLRDIQRWIRKHRTDGPLFDTLFAFQKAEPKMSTHDFLWSPREETFEADYPLAFEVEHMADGGFNLTLACQAYLSDNNSSNNLLKRFEELLQQMVKNVDQPLPEVIMNENTFEYRKHLSMNDTSCNSIKNGEAEYVDGNTESRTFTSEALQIVREEIASLAKMDPDAIHENTSIFEVGLDSIDSVKLSSRLKKVTGVQLPVSKVMKLLTSRKIAAAIKDYSPSKEPESDLFQLKRFSRLIETSLRDSGLDLSTIETILPCTPLQEGLVADMLNSDFQRYLNFDVLKLDERTEIDVLKSAWMKVIETFPILRTRFVNVEDPHVDCTIAQVVMRTPRFDFQEVLVTSENDFTQVYANIREDVKRTFEERPALRLTFVRNAAKSKFLVLTLPHAMYDGWSLGLLHEHVHRFYRGVSNETPSYEPALSHILDNSGNASFEFWRQTLSDTKPSLFPVKYDGVQEVNRAQRSSRVQLASVNIFCRQNRVTTAALCQTVWSVVMSHHHQQLDISFAQVLSGRTHEAVNEVVFPTMNTIISRAVIHGTRAQMARYIQDNLSTITEHQHFPLRKALALASNEYGKEIFNTLFIFQKSVQDDTASEPQLYKSVHSVSSVEYPVCVEAEVIAKEHLLWRTACGGAYLNKQETESLLEDLDSVLETIIANPEDAIVEFSDGKMRLCGLPWIQASVQYENATNSEPASSEGFKQQEAWSNVEQLVRGVIANVAKLDVNEVSKQSSLLALGLDSISSIKVSSLLRKQGLKLSTNEILSAGSVQKIAELANGAMDDLDNQSQQHQSLDHVQNSGKYGNSPKRLLGNIDADAILHASNIELTEVEQVLPATAGQMLLLTRWQNEGIYYSSLDFSANGCADIGRLRFAWSVLVENSPSLRTVFLATGKRTIPVLQAVLKKVPAQFTEVSLKLSLEQEANCVDPLQSRSVLPPCALFAQKTKDDRIELAMKISHALYDGFSIKMLINSLQELVNNPSKLPVRQDFTFSTYLATITSSCSKREFWTNYLSDVKSRSLPHNKARKSGDSIKQLHVVKANVLRDLTSLRAFGRKNQVSVQSLLLASYSIAHALTIRQSQSQYHTVDDVLIGLFMANRNTDGADELVAPTLGFAPVRVRRPLDRSLRDIARGIQEDTREISEDGRGQVGLWELEDWLGQKVKVDVWVNILRQWLPDKSTGDQNSVQIITGEKSEDLEKEYDTHRFDEDISHGLLLKNNAVRDCYDYPMMDLEATIKDDNMDIGVQGPSTLLTMDDARRVIQEVSSRLNDLA